MRLSFKPFVFILFLSSFPLMAQEICDNAIDDDGDGLTDLLDSECTCSGILDNDSVLSFLPNSSFENMLDCPLGFDGDHLVEGWWHDFTEPTADYLNHCGWIASIDASSPLYNFPHGDGVMGAIIMDEYKEYIGTALTEPLLAGHSYTIELFVGAYTFSNAFPFPIYDSLQFVAPPLDITIFGSEDAAAPVNDPFVNVFDCLLPPDWEVVASMYYVPQEAWSSITVTFVPQRNIKSLVIGGPCTLNYVYPDFPIPTDYAHPYFVWDGIRVNTPDSFSSRIEKTGALCTNNLLLSAVIDTAGVNYQWYFNNIALIGENSSTLDAVMYGAGEYSVVFSLNGACETRTISVMGTAGNLPPMVNVITDTVCSGLPASLSIVGNADYYTWDPVEMVETSGNGNTATINLDSTITYTVTGYLNDCPKDTTFEVVVVQTPVMDLLALDTTCIGETYPLTIPLNNIDSLSWVFAGQDDPIYIHQLNDSVFLLETPYNSSYIFTAYNQMCLFIDTLTIIANNPLPLADALLLEDEGFVPFVAELENHTQSYISNTYYVWNFGNGDSLVTTSLANVNATYSEPGIYEVCLKAVQTDYYNPSNQSPLCWTTWCDTLKINDPDIYELEFPNVFTPDGDGVNDAFIVKSEFLEDLQISILNRWGGLVYFSKGNFTGWDGTVDGTKASEGIYFYSYTATTASGLKLEGGGFLHLLR